MNEELKLRPEDFRQSWARALHVAMHEGTNILDRVDVILEYLTVHQERLDVLGNKMPAAIRAAQDVLEQSGASACESIEQSTAKAVHQLEVVGLKIRQEIELASAESGRKALELASTQTKLNESMTTFLLSLEKERKDLVQMRSVVAKEREALSVERHARKVSGKKEVAPVGFWKRLFG